LISSYRETGSARPEEPQHEAQRAENENRVLGEGQPAPSPPAMWAGRLLSSPNKVRDGAPAA